ncbi:MAG: hypothetical protein ACLRQY_08360 [[Clostridium] leptum]
MGRQRERILMWPVCPQKTFADMVAILDQVAAWLDPTAGTKQLVLMMCQTGILWPAFRYGGL